MGKLAVVAGAVAVAAVGVVGGSYVVGGKVEDGFRAAVAKAASGGITVRVLDYERGIFGAKANTMWTVQGEDEPFDFTVSHAIEHGPLPAGKAAQIHSVLNLPEGVKQVFDEFLKGRAALELATTVGWSGAQQHVLSSPDVVASVGPMSATWGGLRGEITADADWRVMKGQASAPVFRMKSEDGERIELEGLTMSFDSSKPQGRQFWVGPGKVALERLAVITEESGELEAAGLVIDSDMQLKGDVVEMTIDGALRKLGVDGEKVDDLALRLALRNLDAGVLDRFTQLIDSLGRDGEDAEAQNARVLAAFAQEGPALLKRKPEIQIERVAGRTAEGVTEFGMRLAYVGEAPEQFNPFTDLAAGMNVSVPKALLERAMQGQVHDEVVEFLETKEVEVSEEEMAEGVREAARERIDELVAKGMLVGRDQAWTLQADFASGEFKLNGKAASPADLQELGLPL